MYAFIIPLHYNHH